MMRFFKGLNRFSDVFAHRRLLGFLSLLVFFTCQNGYAFEIKDVKTLPAENSFLDLSNNLYYFYSEEEPLNLDEISSLDRGQWKRNDSAYLNWTDGTRAMWLKAEFYVESPIEKQWLIHFPMVFIDFLDVHVFINGELVNNYDVRFRNKFGKKPIRVNDHGFPFELGSGSHVQFLFWSVANPNSYIPISVKTLTSFTTEKRLEGIIHGVFFGMLLAMALYNLFLYFSIRDRSYLIYALFVTSANMFFITLNGFGFEYFWPDQPFWNRHASLFFLLSIFLFSCYFIIHFLRLDRVSRRLANYFRVLGYLNLFVIAIIVFSLYSSLLIYNTLVSNLTALIEVICCVSFLVTGLFSWKSGTEYAKYYVFAWLIFCLTMMYGAASYSSFLPFNYHVVYWIQLGSVMEALLISFALAARIKNMREEKLDAISRDKAKSIFLAKVTHDLKNPMTAALSCNEMLRDKLVDEGGMELNELVIDSTRELLATIDEILDFSKIEAGKINFNREVVDLDKISQEVVEICRPMALEKSIDLIFDKDESVTKLVIGDPLRIKQIIYNYINNAIKFTSNGEVVLKLVKESNSRNRYTFNVYDTGIGIKKSDHKYLFKNFSQAASNAHKNYAGTGLGLVICKQLSEMMGGKVGFSSKEGSGSHFWAELILPEV